MCWYREAAAEGLALAQVKLSSIYLEGTNVPQDLVSVHMWFIIAAANGAEGAGKMRDELAEIITPSQRKQAEARAGVHEKERQGMLIERHCYRALPDGVLPQGSGRFFSLDFSLIGVGSRPASLLHGNDRVFRNRRYRFSVTR